ncbi:C4-dicarboxylate TRAP transporter substrate-binding protein [Alteromonas sp. AMM-1]|uniref:C4-dicarboxylate TRAP transporter substrate-binding protein n=1 Tax=Alteromonas sp. AMM-1 TaxID=3394233 RepID=UPI0039A7876D
MNPFISIKYLLAMATLLAMQLSSSLVFANTLNVVTSLSQSDPMYQGLVYFKQSVERQTNNDISVRIFVGSQLGNDNDVLEQAMAGAPVAVLVDAGRLSFYQREIGILSAPYLIDKAEQLHLLVQSPMFEQWAGDLANSAGIKILGFNWWQGERHLLTNQPITTPADLDGIRLRTIGAPVWISTIRAMGATPTPLSWAEVYSGLQQRVIDGAEAQHAGTYGARLYEVIRYISKTRHIHLISGLVASQSWFSQLTPSQQAAVQQSAIDAGNYATSLVQARQRDIEQELEANGVQNITPNIDAFRRATKSVYDELGYDALYLDIQQYLAEQAALPGESVQ